MLPQCLAAEPGFEPGMNESESLVLPLHHSATSNPRVPSAPFIIPARVSRYGYYADVFGTPRHCTKQEAGVPAASETIAPEFDARVYNRNVTYTTG